MARPSFASTSNPRTKAVSRSRPLLPAAPPALAAQPVAARAGPLLSRAGEGDAEGVEHGPLGLQDGVLRDTRGLRDEAGEAFADVHGAHASTGRFELVLWDSPRRVASPLSA